MIKSQKGITLVSLIIILVLMTILASTVVTMSLDRFEINSLRKMFNDIELLQDKVSNYYLKYGALPVLRDDTNAAVQYTYTTLDFDKNSADNDTYYILDLEAMEGISLNYGEEGFKNPNASDDVYIINEASHTVYYPQGMELQGIMHYTLTNITGIAEDVIPPSTPQIKVVSGTQNAKGQYTSEVELELIPGREDGNVAKQTEYSLDNGGTWTNITELDNSIYKIATTGEHSVKLKSYDKNGNATEEVALDLDVEIRIRKTLTVSSANKSWLDLPRSYAGRASQFKIYGNSIQDTTNGDPSPTNPVEVESVGELTKNMFNIEGRVKTDLGAVSNATSRTFTGNGYFVGIAHNNYYYEPNVYEYTINSNENEISLKGKRDYGIGFDFKAEPNTTYTFSIKESGTRVCLTEYSSDGLCVGFKYNMQSATYTTTENAVWIVASVLASENDTVFTFSNIQLEKGSTATEYEPYGYKIPVKVSGINVARVNDGGVGNDYRLIYGIPVKAGDKITYIVNFSHSSTGEMIPRIYSDEALSNLVYAFDNFNKEQDVVITITMPYNGYFTFAFGHGLYNSVTFDKLFVAFGEYTLEDYEPYQEQSFNIYLDEPLRKVGDVSDYIDFSTGKVVRYIKEKIFTGTETWSPFEESRTDFSMGIYYTNSAEFGVYQNTTFVPNIGLSNQFSIYTTAGMNTKDDSRLGKMNIYDAWPPYWAFKVPYTNLNDWNTFLAQKYNEGDPLRVYYALKVSGDTETIELPELKTFNEYTTIQVLTEVPPSEIYAEYEGYEFQ